MEQAKTKYLECVLNEEEITEKGRHLARAEEEREKNAALKKAAMAGFKSTDDALAATISTLTTQINNQREWRNVPVEERPDYERFVMETYRCDTGERVGSRAMTTEELQQKLPFAEEAAKSAKQKS